MLVTVEVEAEHLEIVRAWMEWQANRGMPIPLDTPEQVITTLVKEQVRNSITEMAVVLSLAKERRESEAQQASPQVSG